MTQTYSTPPAPGFVENVEIQGHIIDSLILPKVLGKPLAGEYILRIGRPPHSGQSSAAARPLTKAIM